MNIESFCCPHNLPAQKLCMSLEECSNRLLCSKCEDIHPVLHRLEIKSLDALQNREELSTLR